MKNFLIEFFRPLDNLLFNYFVKIGAIKPFIGALIGGALAARSASKARKEQRAAEERSRGDITRAFEQIRDPRDILTEAYGPGGFYSPEVMETILGRERGLIGPMTDLLKEYGETVAFSEGGLQELSKQTTEDILSRMKELGPEFRKAMEDPRVSSLVDEQLAKFKQTYADTEATSAEREAAAKEFDTGLKSALGDVGVSLDAIQQAEIGSAKPFLEGIRDFDTSRIRDFDLGALTDFDTSALRDFDFGGLRDLSFDELKNLGLDQSTAFLGDIRGLTDIERAEAERLTEAARGPLGFEATRRAEQAARAEGGALGRQLDASAIARAALGREEAVMAREDRAAAARARAAQLAGLGGKLGLSQESLRGDLAAQAAQLGLTQQQYLARLGLSAEEAAAKLGLTATEAATRLGLGAEEAASRIGLSALGMGAEVEMGLDKLGLAKQELAGLQAMRLAQLQGNLAAQARQEALRAREEGRAQYGTALTSAQAASVDPSQIFFSEAQPAFNLYSSILGQTPGTIFTDPGQAISLGSATDVQRANILGGQSAIAAQQAAGAGARAASGYSTAGQLLGGIDFSQMRNPFAQSTPSTVTFGGQTPTVSNVNPNAFSFNLFP